MHACSLGLFLVTTALQLLAGGCTKMSWDTEQVWLKFPKILLNFSVHLLLVLNTMQVDCQEPCLSNVSGPFRKWHYKDQLLTYNLSLKKVCLPDNYNVMEMPPRTPTGPLRVGFLI